jgi:hypothetical protein
MIMVAMRACGTAVEALMQSSARWMAPSSPEYIKFGFTRPVRKTIPSDQPESLTNVFHTYSFGCLGPAIARHVMKKMTKQSRDNATGEIVSKTHMRRQEIPTADVMCPCCLWQKE